MKFHITKIVLLFLLFSILSSQKNNELNQILNNENDWIKLIEKEKITISLKNISGQSVHALKIESKTNIPLKIIQDVIMDINNYKSIFINSHGMETIEIDNNNNNIIAYQFIPINFPFFNHRHYLFKMKKNPLENKNKQKLIEWHLIPSINEYTDSLINKKNDSIYLNTGAGSWTSYTNNKGEVILSYRLFMNPEGWIPNVFINRLNKINIVNIYKDVINESKKRTKLNF